MSSSQTPLVTIVTPSFNQGIFIERTIQSILSQDYPYIEHIVVDGGSTDETLEILRRYEGRLRWISEKDNGQSDAINKGFRMAKGEILSWLNSDDIYLPGAVTKATRFMAEHPEVMTVYGEGYIIDELDRVKEKFPFTEPKFDLTKLIYNGDYILQQTSFFRKALFETIEMLEVPYHYTMDWDLFIRIGKRFPIGYLPEDIACIREHGTAKTTVGGKERFREIVGMLRKHSIMRYPPAYFNYMWDAYGKDIFDTPGSDGGAGFKARILSLVKRFAQYLFDRTGLQRYNGWYADGWIGRKGLITLPNYEPSQPKTMLYIRGKAVAPNAPIKIKVRVNRKYDHRLLVSRPGVFSTEFTLPEVLQRDDAFHVELLSDSSYVPSDYGVKEDSRRLAFILEELAIR
ncbi:MAG: glycosyltransferase family 2 protein [Ignavibacteriales bacterium]|nr:glycosyltransferase family 2 protein [Ignavibacteriales bacterium]